MGLFSSVLGSKETVFRRKFRWLFEISGIVGDELPMLPPLKAARPAISIKEMEVRHLDEVVYYPGRQDWKTINLTLYHIQCDNNPIFEWLRLLYDPKDDVDPFKYGLNPPPTFGLPGPATGPNSFPTQFIQRSATCTLYDGCGETMERWIYECVWPTSLDWGELDMESSDIVYVDISLRYARAFVEGDAQ